MSSIIENFIANKIYSALYLDFLLKFLWENIIELWNIGGSAIPATKTPIIPNKKIPLGMSKIKELGNRVKVIFNIHLI